ncbi:hypothetical protein [Pelagicoccus sp. SDUM812005]|uniref:hypothetical protein n=1 Tax=Pelagicoccus sp. SDUM812005 TaxID=3041257 RepID=UPI00280E20FF|nr:hypothetical protein [Pelagicoccus sp. SDUM812005]MDQ8179927.1 hypothetical protein [Pelagicoccus sp. SDUM812005]
MKDKRPSKFTLLLPLAAILFLSYFWTNAHSLAQNGSEHRVTITEKRSPRRHQQRSYFTLPGESRRLDVTAARGHRVGSEIDVIVLGNRAIAGKKSDFSLFLAIRDLDPIHFWLIVIVAILYPLYRWLSYLPDDSFAWLSFLAKKRPRSRRRRLASTTAPAPRRKKGARR